MRLAAEVVVPESETSACDLIWSRVSVLSRQSRFLHRVLGMAALASLCLNQATPAPAQVWRDVTPAAGDSPVPRRTAAAVLDPDGRQLILFGGRGSAGDLNDLWSLDLGTHTWARIETPSSSRPLPRFTPNAVFDQRDRRLYMWAGRQVNSEGSGFFNDAWAFSLETETWTELAPSGRFPERRYGNVSIFDPLSRSLITFAGFTDLGRFDDTWRLAVDAVAWEQLTPSINPGKRCLHTAAHDTRDHRMIIFGGQRGAGTLADIWSFDLGTGQWRELTPAQGGPGGRRYAVSAYDSRRHGVLVVGGDDGIEKAGDVWLFDLDSATWLPLAPAGPGPEPRDGAVAVYVETEDRLVLFGGTGDGHKNDVWSLEELGPVVTAVSEPVLARPQRFGLEQNHPNPFNSRTSIGYAVPDLAVSSPAMVRLSIYDLLGRDVRVLVRSAQVPGRQVVVWDGRDNSGVEVSSGVYLYRLEIEGMAATRKLLLLQ